MKWWTQSAFSCHYPSLSLPPTRAATLKAPQYEVRLLYQRLNLRLSYLNLEFNVVTNLDVNSR